MFEGEPCIRGLRIPVSLIIKLISAGKTPEEILKDYPELENEDIKQSLEFAAWVVSEKTYHSHFTMATEILDNLRTKWQQHWSGLPNWLAELQFSSWVLWNQRDRIDHANKPGVYILAIYGETEEVPHSVELDESVIYVGKTNVGKTTSLRKRLDCFDRAAFGNGCPHAGGYTYRECFGTSQQGLYVSACPVCWLEERKELVANNKTHSDNLESDDIQSFIISQVITELEVCLRGLYVFKWGRLPKCNKE